MNYNWIIALSYSFSTWLPKHDLRHWQFQAKVVAIWRNPKERNITISNITMNTSLVHPNTALKDMKKRKP